MHFSSPVLFFTSTVAGLGINCRGSGFCDLTFGSSIQDIQDQIGILVADGQGDRHFDTGGKVSSVYFDNVLGLKLTM
jgi:hypothetical protein